MAAGHPVSMDRCPSESACIGTGTYLLADSLAYGEDIEDVTAKTLAHRDGKYADTRGDRRWYQTGRSTRSVRGIFCSGLMASAIALISTLQVSSGI